MTTEKKKADPWHEKVAFVECPYCSHCNELGTDVYWEDGEECDCEQCSKTFILGPAEDDDEV